MVVLGIGGTIQGSHISCSSQLTFHIFYELHSLRTLYPDVIWVLKGKFQEVLCCKTWSNLVPLEKIMKFSPSYVPLFLPSFFPSLSPSFLPLFLFLSSLPDPPSSLYPSSLLPPSLPSSFFLPSLLPSFLLPSFLCLSFPQSTFLSSSLPPPHTLIRAHGHNCMAESHGLAS